MNFRFPLLASILLASAALSAHASEPPTSVVLVHGAFADGSSWDKVIPLLHAKGLNVVAVQNPLTSLTDDVSATQRAIKAQPGKVVLVGHSWGGTVITQAGVDDKVKALVYVAAFAPDAGQATTDLGKEYPVSPGLAGLVPDPDGFLSLSADSLATNFAQDLPRVQTNLLAVTQGPIRARAFDEQVTAAAWKYKPNYYIVAANDRMIPPQLELEMSRRLKATTTTLVTGHVPMLSQPRAVADVIIQAAQR